MKIRKTDGTITVKGPDGRIVDNIAGGTLAGPAASVSVELDLDADTLERLARQARALFRAEKLAAAEDESRDYIAEHGLERVRNMGVWEAHTWGATLNEITRATMDLPVEKRADIAADIATSMRTHTRLYPEYRGYDVYHIDGVEEALEQWDIEKFDEIVDAEMDQAVENAEEGLYLDLLHQYEDDITDSESFIWALQSINSSYGDWADPQQSAFEETTKKGYGILDSEPTPAEDAIQLLRERYRDGVVHVNTMEELETLTSLLPEGGIHGLPVPIRVPKGARAQILGFLQEVGFESDFTERFGQHILED